MGTIHRRICGEHLQVFAIETCKKGKSLNWPINSVWYEFDNKYKYNKFKINSIIITTIIYNAQQFKT